MKIKNSEKQNFRKREGKKKKNHRSKIPRVEKSIEFTYEMDHLIPCKENRDYLKYILMRTVNSKDRKQETTSITVGVRKWG